MAESLTQWVAGAERVCVKCGAEIKNLERDVGEVRSRFLEGRRVTREIVCTKCHLGPWADRG